jgi:hypothetical protein
MGGQPYFSKQGKANLDLKLHHSVQNMEFTVVKPKEARQVDADETSKNQQGDIITGAKGERDANHQE